MPRGRLRARLSSDPPRALWGPPLPPGSPLDSARSPCDPHSHHRDGPAHLGVPVTTARKRKPAAPPTPAQLESAEQPTA